MEDGIWVSESVFSHKGDEVVVCVRLDTAVDPEIMFARLEKEAEELNKKSDKLIDKLDRFNNKTPQKIIDSTIQELTKICKLQSINITESLRWSEAWRLKIEQEQ